MVVLFALLSGQVFAQNGRCQEFQVAEDGYWCYIQYFIPWVAFGNGWTSKLRGANISFEQNKGPVWFGWATYSAKGKALLTVYLKDNRWPYEGSTQVATHQIPQGESIEVTLLSPMAGCDKNGYNCSKTPDPTTTLTGAAVIRYLAEDPAWLRGLPRPSVQFNYTGGLQATEPALDPAPVWRSPVTASVDGYEKYSFAIGNPGKTDIIVEGNIINQTGKILGTRTWTVYAGGTVGTFLTSSPSASPPGFGTDPFSGGNSWFEKDPPPPSGKDFTGWLELKVISPTNGMMNLMAIQYTGNAMSTADIQRFDK